MNPEELIGVEQLPIAGAEATAASEVPAETKEQIDPVQFDDLPLAHIARGIDNVIGTDLTTAYIQSQQRGQQELAQLEEDMDELVNDGGIGEFTDKTVGEATRAVVGGVAGAVEGVVNTADLAGDFIKQQFIEEDESENVLNADAYQSSEFSSGCCRKPDCYRQLCPSDHLHAHADAWRWCCWCWRW